MNNKIVGMCIVLLLTVTLSGCWDVNEPQRMLYLNGIGIDFKNGQYEVYTQIINFSNTAKSEQPTTDEASQAEVGHATGRSLDEAIFQLYHSVDQKIFWGHLSYIVMSEDALKEKKLNEVLDIFIRYRETRYQIWVYATKDSVEDVLLIRPVTNKAIILSKLGDPTNSFKQESFVKPISIREIIIGLNEPNHEVLLPLITVEENWSSMKEKITAPVFTGAGIIAPNEFKGFINDDLAKGIRWMSNETIRSNITFKTDNDSYISVIMENIDVNITPFIENGEAKFDVAIYTKGTAEIITDSIKPPEMEKEIKKVMEKEIRTTYQEALKMDADIYRLSEQLYRKKVKEWKRLQTDGKVELKEDSIRNIDITIEKLKSNRRSFERTVE